MCCTVYESEERVDAFKFVAGDRVKRPYSRELGGRCQVVDSLDRSDNHRDASSYHAQDIEASLDVVNLQVTV